MPSDQIFSHRRTAFAAAFGAFACAMIPPALSFAQGAKASVPLSDARGIGEKTVRIVAGQHSNDGPSIALFGMQASNWPRVRDAIHQTVKDGFAVKAIFMGPTGPTIQPSLEVYARGLQVAKPGLDPNTISSSDLAALIRAVSRRYFPQR